MGQLVEQSVKTLYQGVSRQPHSNRLPGQVQEADNVSLSVVSGGFQRRSPTTHLNVLSSFDPSSALYVYDRDGIERYLVSIGTNSTPKVYSLIDGEAGNTKTVNVIDAGAETYLQSANPISNLRFLTIGDFTLIANTGVTVGYKATNTQGYPIQEKVLIWCRTTNESTDYTIKWNGTTVASDTSGTSKSNTQLADAFETQLQGHSSLFSVSRLDTVLVLTPVSGTTPDVEVTGSTDTFGPLVINKQTTKREFLPPRAPADYVVEVAPTDETDGYYARFDDTRDVWEEIADPNVLNELDPATLPVALIRQPDGSFNLEYIAWEPREVGNVDTNPDPDFVGKTLTDIALFKDRLVFVSGEQVTFSRIADYFNFFRQESTQVLDDDTFSMTASSTAANFLLYATSFRKALFVTSNKTQFEVTGSTEQGFTPKVASIDMSTMYDIEQKCRPIVIGNKMYFAGESGSNAVVYEYVYDDATVSNKAANVLLHAKTYIPANITTISGDTASETVVMRTDAETNALYVYQQFEDGGEKAQMAWSRWYIGDEILLAQYLLDSLYLVVKRGSEYCLEKMLTDNEVGELNVDFEICLDRMIELSGTFDGTWTTYVLPYAPDQSKTIVFPDNSSQVVGTQEPEWLTANSFRVLGDVGGQMIVGQTYESRVVLSKQLLRSPENPNATVTSGRFQLRKMDVNFTDTGYLKVDVSNEGRTTKSFSVSPNVLNTVQLDTIPAMLNGRFSVPVRGKAEDVEIAFVSDSHFPCTVTHLDFVGFYNSKARQG